MVKIRKIRNFYRGRVREELFVIPNIVHDPVAFFGVFVNLAVSDALEAPGAGQSGPKASNPGEHIKISNQIYAASLCS